MKYLLRSFPYPLLAVIGLLLLGWSALRIGNSPKAQACQQQDARAVGLCSLLVATTYFDALAVARLLKTLAIAKEATVSVTSPRTMLSSGSATLAVVFVFPMSLVSPDIVRPGIIRILRLVECAIARAMARILVAPLQFLSMWLETDSI